jgi:hypothetical protein
MIIEQPVTQFLDELASSAATPGGGSVRTGGGLKDGTAGGGTVCNTATR